MHILVHFQFNDEKHPVAISGVEGDVTDFILPSVGDTVQHRNEGGDLFMGRVTERIYRYDLPNGLNVSGAVTVTLFLDHVQIH